MKVLVLTISDSSYANPTLDKSGPALTDLLNGSLRLFVDLVENQILPDESFKITETLKSTASNYDVILTTGGTGLSLRDVTPEATKRVVERECPGIVTALLMRSLQATPLAALSCLASGTLGKCLIVNLPGNPKAVKECFEVLENILEHAVEVLNDKPYKSTILHNKTV